MITVAEPLRALHAECVALRSRLQVIVENRSLWVEAIEGCRGALAMMTDVAVALEPLCADAEQLAADLASAHAENTTLNRSHADLAVVEQQLRVAIDAGAAELRRVAAEAAALRQAAVVAAATERELRAAVAERDLALDDAALALTAARRQAEADSSIWATLEQQLRAELEQLTVALAKRSTALAAEIERGMEHRAAAARTEHDLRADLDQYRAAYEQRCAAVANAQALAQQLISETAIL